MDRISASLLQLTCLRNKFSKIYQMFTKDRQQAAKILHVSLRTIDRYIQRGILRKKVVNGKILVNDVDLKDLKVQRGFENEYQEPTTTVYSQDHSGQIESTPPISPAVQPQTIANSPQFHQSPSEHIQYKLQDLEVYKKLYEEMQEELKEKRRQLEGANYRLGQLEGQLKESVPLLDYKKLMVLQETTTENLKSKDNEIKQIEAVLKEEKLNRTIYMIFLIILVILQPLWLLLPLIK